MIVVMSVPKVDLPSFHKLEPFIYFFTLFDIKGISKRKK